MSYKNTIPLHSSYSNFDNCLRAVKECDGFVGLIRGYYGTGRMADGLTITHHEQREAIRLDKRRWMWVEYEVEVARQLLKQYRYNDQEEKVQLEFRPTAVLQDIRVLEMYEEAMRYDLPLNERTGNWVQPFKSSPDLLDQVATQLSKPKAIWGQGQS